MNRQFAIAVALALLVFALGVFLLGRDGTEETAVDVNKTPDVSTEELLPVNTSTSTETGSSTVELEPGDENSASTTEVIDLEEVGGTKNVVTYTDNGFSPKTLTIAQGDTVVFVNESKRNMWVASDVHPTHNSYPEESEDDCLGSTFDACTGVPSGSSWSFTFNRIGEWGYHNHLSVSRTGTIIVE